MTKTSAGLLMYRQRHGRLEVFLVHPGGPFWRNKDDGAWSIPKGEYGDEEPLAAARREFHEETGLTAEGPFRDLGERKQKGGKVIRAWAFAGDCEAAAVRSNTFTMEWPPRSGRREEFPEVDRAAWFPLDEARNKILPGQLPFLDDLEAGIAGQAQAGTGRPSGV